MGFSSQAGQAILRTQSAEGVYANDLATKGVAIKLRSGSLAPSRTLMIPDPEIGGGRDIADAYLGGVSWAGDYEFYARLKSITTLLKAGLGAVVSTADQPVAGVQEHVFTPSDGAQLPFLSLEEGIGSNLETYKYTDVVVNTLHFESDASGYLQGTAGLIAKTQEAGAARTDADALWDDGPMLVGTNIDVTYNGVTVGAKSFSFDLNNNFADDDYRLGSFFIGDLTPAGREVTAGFSIREKDSALWRQAVYGVSSATSPGGLVTKSDLKIVMSTYEVLGSTAQVGKFTIEIPKFAINPYAFSASGADIIESDISGQALRPNAADAICTLTVVNETAEIA